MTKTVKIVLDGMVGNLHTAIGNLLAIEDNDWTVSGNNPMNQVYSHIKTYSENAALDNDVLKLQLVDISGNDISSVTRQSYLISSRIIVFAVDSSQPWQSQKKRLQQAISNAANARVLVITTGQQAAQAEWHFTDDEQKAFFLSHHSRGGRARFVNSVDDQDLLTPISLTAQLDDADENQFEQMLLRESRKAVTPPPHTSFPLDRSCLSIMGFWGKTIVASSVVVPTLAGGLLGHFILSGKVLFNIGDAAIKGSTVLGTELGLLLGVIITLVYCYYQHKQQKKSEPADIVEPRPVIASGETLA